MSESSRQQCAIPAFESLLPEPHNSILMTLLFICAQWHALAKLMLHNDFTLACLEYMTTRLGAQMRRFDQETCAVAPTKELLKEADARARREGKGKGRSSQKTSDSRYIHYQVTFPRRLRFHNPQKGDDRFVLHRDCKVPRILCYTFHLFNP